MFADGCWNITFGSYQLEEITQGAENILQLAPDDDYTGICISKNQSGCTLEIYELCTWLAKFNGKMSKKLHRKLKNITKNIKEDLNRQRNISWSGIETHNTVKMSTLSKLIYRFN